MGKRTWTKEEEDKLKDLYFNGMKVQEIAIELNKTVNSIKHKIQRLRICDEYIRSNSVKYKAIYQDYEWCYDRYINKGMTHQEMADEAKCKLRVMQKWCADIFGLNQWTFKEYKHLNNIQYQIILFGTLGDGHIDSRVDQPMYIESHSAEETDYVFWKYEQLKDLCNHEPVYYKESYNSFGGNKKYLCKPFYRINTRIINELKDIREMSRLSKIKMLNEFGFSLHILDDGCRCNLWQVCLAGWTQEEVETYISICKEKFNLECQKDKDERYVNFTAVSSKKIDEIILRNIPNDLDIIRKKILNNNKIKDLRHHRYIICNNKKVGLSAFCKLNHINYEYCRDIFDSLDAEFIDEGKFLEMVG